MHSALIKQKKNWFLTFTHIYCTEISLSDGRVGKKSVDQSKVDGNTFQDLQMRRNDV